MRVKMRYMVQTIVEYNDNESWDRIEEDWFEGKTDIENALFDLPGNVSVIEYDLEEL